MTSAPKGLRGYLPPVADADQPQPAHVWAGELGPMIPIMSNSPAQWVAKTGMMLRVLVGSGVHGMAIAGTDDEDQMGVCVEAPDTVIGHRRFKHYTYRTQPEGVCSGPGDLDLVIYGLRRYQHLAASGNPTTLLPLFVPDEHVLWVNDFGRELRERRHLFISKLAGARFLGYLESQRRGLMGLRSGGTNGQGRADLRAKYGFDVKFAAHMVRLGLQGVELLSTGTITLPVPEPDLTWLRDLRQGHHTKEEALDRALDLEDQIKRLMTTSTLPERPDYDAIDAWVISVHRRHWGW
jgi:uncharacterized protein